MLGALFFEVEFEQDSRYPNAQTVTESQNDSKLKELMTDKWTDGIRMLGSCICIEVICLTSIFR